MAFHGDPLTRAGMKEQLELLNNIWPRYRLSPEQFDGMVNGYGEALKEYGLDATKGAIQMCLKQDTRWPSPARLRELAAEWNARNRPFLTKSTSIGPIIDGEDDDGSCRVCHAKPRWAVLIDRDWATSELRTVRRRIQPCHADQHPEGSPYVPLPPNFLDWAEETFVPPVAAPAQPEEHEEPRGERATERMIHGGPLL